jgi:hypothetical protein
MVGRVLAKDEVGVRFSLSALKERSDVRADRNITSLHSRNKS